MWLYEPKDGEYDGYVHTEDQIMNGPFSWRYLMDIYVANNGRESVTKQKLRKEFDDFFDMIRRDSIETFDLIADKMVAEIRKEK